MKIKGLKWIVIGFVLILLSIGIYVECNDIRHTHPGTEVGDNVGPADN